ncbi:Lrp/AsnC family transcriptional regulator [Leifsonia kafniensis]|uniref:Lrp/AsnC family transcriptional regulator n=1 Tax=Leifsonia kafniensis TaxID=475957 RepID=A0ABP7KTP3_9MICO
MLDTLDDIDRRILSILQKDGRLSVSAVATAARVSRANAYNRINRMTDAGIITGYMAQIDPSKLGMTASAFVMIRTEQDSWQIVRDRVTRIPEVKHVALVAGDFDVIVLIRASDNADLRRVILTELQSIPHIRDTKTSIIFEEEDTR